MTAPEGNLPASELAMLRLLLNRLGITPEQLLDIAAEPAAAAPTFSEYIDRVAVAVKPGTLKTYKPYWERVRTVWGDRRITEPTPLEITQLAEAVRAAAVVRRNARGGRSAAEHCIAALRCLYGYAVRDGIIAEGRNPAIRVQQPRRLASTRHALRDKQLAAIVRTTSATGNDPELDGLILRVHIETACRRGGALALRPRDLDPAMCLVLLREKGETSRWQPVSPSLMRMLERHRDTRGDGAADGQLLRYRNRRPITSRRYDYIFERVGRYLPWVATQQISAHWLRHTALTWVERHFGYAVARAFAGHEGRSDAGTTATYVRATLYEVAAAVAALTGEPHPLAGQHEQDDDDSDDYPADIASGWGSPVNADSAVATSGNVART